MVSWREHTVAGDPGGRSVLKYISDELGIAENTTIGAFRPSTGVVTVSDALEAEAYRVSPELVDQISVMLSGAGVFFHRDNLAVVLSTIKVVDAILRVPVAERGGLAALSVTAISKQLGFKTRSNASSSVFWCVNGGRVSSGMKRPGRWCSRRWGSPTGISRSAWAATD